MNTSVLLLTALIVFAFGYRFYGKMLGLWVFRLDPKYSTSILPQTDTPSAGPARRHLVFGQHIAAVGTLSTLVGVAIALVWGWVGPYLWVVVGTAVIAAALIMGGIWMALRNHRRNPAELAGLLIGPRVRLLYYCALLVFLLIAAGIAVTQLSAILVSFPTAVAPFWLLFPIALAFGAYIQHRDNRPLWLPTLFAAAAAYLAMTLLSHYSVALSGALNIDIQGSSRLSIDSRLGWGLIMLLLAHFTNRASVARTMRPRGYLAGILLLIMLLVLGVAIIFGHPPATAPSVHRATGAPSVFPLLLLVVSGGAVAGFHFVLAYCHTARQLIQETDARYVGYGGVVVDALLAITAIVVFAVGFRDLAANHALYTAWQSFPDISELLRLYIYGAGQILTVLGLEAGVARTLVAVTIAAALYITLETSVRMWRRLAAELAGQYDVKPLTQAKSASGLMLLVLAGLLTLGQAIGRDFNLWPLFGVANIITVCFGLLLLLLFLKGLHRPRVYIALPLAAIAIIGNWAIVNQLAAWWSGGQWPWLVCGVLLFAVELGVLVGLLPKTKTLTQTPDKSG